MSQEVSDGRRHHRGKAPLYQCDECGERLYMTLEGVRCFNCWSPRRKPVSASEATEETVAEAKARIRAKASGTVASRSSEASGSERSGEGEEEEEDEGEKVREVIAAPLVSGVVDLREGGGGGEREGEGEEEEIESTS